MKKICLLLGLGMLICLPGMASAWDMQSTTGLYNGEAPISLDAVELFIVSGPDTFQAPGTTFVSGGSGWAVSIPNPLYTVATGPIDSNLGLNYWFTGASVPSTPVVVDFFGWANGILNGAPADEGSMTFSSAGFTWSWGPDGVTDPSGKDYNRVPIPPSVLLLGSGLFGLGLLGRRKIFKA